MTMNSLSSARRPAVATARSLCVLLSLLLLPIDTVSAAVADSLDEIRCGPLAPPGQYGPYDYRTATAEQKLLVESAHFTPRVESLQSGMEGRTRPGPDINYTLRAFPNHPRALKSAIDLEVREKTNIPSGMRYTTECWFNRAIRFTPDDPQVRMVYGIYLLRTGDKKAAVKQLELARTMGLSSGNFQYNLGLAYFQAQDYENARLQAYKAKELGYSLDGLKNLLTKAGQWREKEPDKIPPKAEDSTPPKVPDASTLEAAAPKN